MWLVGAAGLEPTTPLEFKQGALTAELHAYIELLYTDGMQRTSLGPKVFVQLKGMRFHIATGSLNFLSTGLRRGTSCARTN